MPTKNQPAGRAFPPGGATGDVLTKGSTDDQDIVWAAPGSISGSIAATDGTTTVDPATSILFSHGSLSDAGDGVAEIDTGIIVTPNGSIDGSTIPGYIIIDGAVGEDGSKGGQIYAQDGSTGQGGVASVHGGLAGPGLNGGGVLIGAGAGDDGDGGGGATVQLAGGPSSGVGGAINISGGNANFGGGHAGGNVSITGGAGDGAGPRGSILITGLPTSDPGVANALYTDGVPSAGVPKALMVSGG